MSLPLYQSEEIVALREQPGKPGLMGRSIAAMLALDGLAADEDITQVCMNFGQHGMDHGHFDTLGLTLFSQGEEVLREYGFARGLNVEPKFGGRYLPGNVSWARQTLAHNTVVVDS